MVIEVSIGRVITEMDTLSQNLEMSCPIVICHMSRKKVSMMNDEKKIIQLIEEAKLNIGRGNHKGVEHLLFQAWGMLEARASDGPSKTTCVSTKKEHSSTLRT